MKCLLSLSDFYKSESGREIGRKISKIISKEIDVLDENVLVLGLGEPILDRLHFKNLYFAIPNKYPVVHWPRIRPFRTVIVDEHRLPFMPETWDVVIIVHVSEFLHNNDNFFREISRILKKNGKLVLVSVNKNNINLFGKGISSIKGVISAKSEITESLSSKYFSVKNIFGVSEEFRFWPYQFSWGLNKFGENFGEISKIFSDVIVIFADKEELSGAMEIEKLNAQYDVT